MYVVAACSPLYVKTCVHLPYGWNLRQMTHFRASPLCFCTSNVKKTDLKYNNNTIRNSYSVIPNVWTINEWGRMNTNVKLHSVTLKPNKIHTQKSWYIKKPKRVGVWFNWKLIWWVSILYGIFFYFFFSGWCDLILDRLEFEKWAQTMRVDRLRPPPWKKKKTIRTST